MLEESVLGCSNNRTIDKTIENYFTVVECITIVVHVAAGTLYILASIRKYLKTNRCSRTLGHLFSGRSLPTVCGGRK